VVTIEPPIYQVRGATILRNSDDPDQLHLLPPTARLAAAGDGLAFTLYKYRRDLTDNPELDPARAKGAGLALFEVEASVANLGAVQAEVAALAGRPDARLSPMLFRSGTVQAIVAHAEGERFIEDLVDRRSAPLTYPHHAAFAMALTAEGTTLFEAAARGGLLPVGVAYELRFLALTPSLHARVHMDYDRIYDHFAASVGFTYYYVSARLDLDLEWLVEHDLIQIEIIAFTDDEDRDRQQQLVMDLVRTRIQNDFFRTGIPPEPEQGMAGPLGQLLTTLVGAPGSEVTSTSALFVLRAKYEVVKERKELDLLFDGRTAVELTHVVTGTLASMTAEGPPPRILAIDLDDRYFSSLDVQVLSTVDFQEMDDLRELAVHLSHGDHRDSYWFSPTDPGPYRFQVALDDPRDDEYEYTVEYHFDPDLGGGANLVTAGPFRSRHRVLVVDPLAHLRYLRLRVLLGPVDPAAVPRIRVHLRVEGEPGQPDLVRDSVAVDAQQPEVLWRQRLPMAFSTPRIFARTEWEDPTGTLHPGDQSEVTGDTFVALGPFRDVLAVSVVPVADWTVVNQVLAEVRYEDGDYRQDRSLAFTAAGGGAAQPVQIPLLDPDRRGYRWRQVLFRKDGTTSEAEWAEVDQALLVVGREPAQPGQVRVVWVGDAAGAFGLQVDFWVAGAAGDEENVPAFLRAGDGETSVRLPLDHQGQLRYRYQVRRFGPEGDEVVAVGTGESALLVVRATG
jgi:hypothetical protein